MNKKVKMWAVVDPKFQRSVLEVHRTRREAWTAAYYLRENHVSHLAHPIRPCTVAIHV